ncbi:Mur ligase family protein [Mycoplasma todarodis]|uniref:Mur ligase family protein n=1 Tax=Mycoplasma todarodis TaxID=1937191 RepID=UPI003B2FCB08
MNLIQSIFNNRKNTSNKVLKTYLDKLNLLCDFKIINVVGTNGKGSVSHYLTENLKQKLTVGTFTSPHIFEANERIQVNGENISTPQLEKYISRYKDKDIHFFGIMFLCAIEYFNDMNCDVVILEAGIGGKHDPSNILDGDIGVITSVGYDHMEIFGETLQDVMNDKIGIINNGMHFYSGSELGVMNKCITEKANELNSKHFIVDNQAKHYKTRNQLLVKEILKNEFDIVANFNEPLGRATLQKINNTIAILDVAHNENGILATLEYLKDKQIPFEQVVITIAKRKDFSNLQNIFKDKDIFVYTLNDSFILAKDIEAKDINNLKAFYNKQNKNTLYIGSFHSIGSILKNE